MVAAGAERQGVGTHLVAVAADGARKAGCEWLHVDFQDHLRSFYFDRCGFVPTNGGLIAL
jgi:N-acetylglutamate synthase-like GNAT family acetyltransferase